MNIFEQGNKTDRREATRPSMTLIERAKQFAPFSIESTAEDEDLAGHLLLYAGGEKSGSRP